MKHQPREGQVWPLRLPGPKACLVILGASNLFLFLAVITGLSSQGQLTNPAPSVVSENRSIAQLPPDQLLSWIEAQEAEYQTLQREARKARIIYIGVGLAGFVNLLFLFLLFVRNQDESKESD